MKRYIKSAKTNITGKHPLDVLFPDMGYWFEEDQFEDLGAILNMDADELRLLVARSAGVKTNDPLDYDPEIQDFYNFFDANPGYLEMLNDYIDEHQDMIEY